MQGIRLPAVHDRPCVLPATHAQVCCKLVTNSAKDTETIKQTAQHHKHWYCLQPPVPNKPLQ